MTEALARKLDSGLINEPKPSV